jgi:hypothetical protein
MKRIEIESLRNLCRRRDVARFWRLWSEAQRLRDIPRMEALLKLKWLPFWWTMKTEQPLNPDIEGAIEIILQNAGVIPVPPERPSERAMRLANAGKPLPPSRRKPLPLP